MKSRFITRLLAWIIDLLVVATLASLFSVFLPTNANLNKVTEEIYNLNMEYLNEKIENSEYSDKMSAYSYQLAKYSTGTTIIQAAVYIAYFVIYQSKNNGQTLGKKLMKIKIVSAKNENTELTINDYVFRSFIINGIIFLLIDIFTILLLPETMYIQTAEILSTIEIIILIINVFMVLYRADGRGLHDFIGQTKVINEK